MSSRKRSTSDLGLPQALADVSRQIQSILDSVEAEAAEIRARAEREAEQYLADKRETANKVLANHIARLEALASEFVTELQAALGSTPAAETQPPRSSAWPQAGSQRSFLRPTPSRAETGAPNVSGRVASAPPLESPDRRAGLVVGPNADGLLARHGKQARQGATAREEAILRATQMAVANKDRSEIEAALRIDLGVEESRTITDEVLGAFDRGGY